MPLPFTRSIDACRGRALHLLWYFSFVIDAVPLHSSMVVGARHSIFFGTFLSLLTPCPYLRQPDRSMVVGARHSIFFGTFLSLFYAVPLHSSMLVGARHSIFFGTFLSRSHAVPLPANIPPCPYLLALLPH